MARSILPSKNREAARKAKRLTKRAYRRTSRRQVADLARRDRIHSDDWDARINLRATADAEIRMIMFYRRQGDKLNHFERWAIARTKYLPLDERLGSMRAVLPKGLIGDHALSHLRRLPQLNPENPDSWWSRHLENRLAAEQATEQLHQRLKLAVEVMVEQGRHHDLNAVSKKTATGIDPRPVRRLLAGVHDIPAFVADVTSHSRNQAQLPHEYQATLSSADRFVPSWRNRVVQP